MTRKKMIRFGAAMAAVLCALSTAACGTDQASNPTEESTDMNTTASVPPQTTGLECTTTAETTTAAAPVTTAADRVSNNADVMQFEQPVILPFGEDAHWSVSFRGVLAPDEGKQGNLLADIPEKHKQVYLGVNAARQTVYLGICINAVYANYCWSVPTDVLRAEHRYQVAWTGGEFLLTIDDDAPLSMTSMNINDGNATAVNGAQASGELVQKIHAVKGQKYVAMTYGAASVADTLATETSSTAGYATPAAHPLADLTIFYLGSSITRGHKGNTDGVSFADMMGSVTGCKNIKKAISGTNLAVTDDRKDSYVERLSQFDSVAQTPDVLIVQLSSNDFKRAVPLGTVSAGKTPEEQDSSTITGAIETIIAQAKQKWPEVKVVVYSCPMKTGWSKYTQYQTYVNGTMKELEEKWAGDMVMLDLFNSPYVRSNAYIQSDNLHPQKEGYAQLFLPEWINFLYNMMNIG